MIRVFISHASKDARFVLAQLVPPLREAGILAWCSATDIPSASDWEQQIRAALNRADWVLVVMSPAAASSEWVRSETHWALENRPGRVIPLLAHGCDPCTVHLRLGTIQFVDFRTDPAAATSRLIALLKADPAGPSRPELPLSAAAQETVLIKVQRAVELRLLIEQQEQTAREQRVLVQRALTLGRADGTDLQVPDDAVSRRHARIALLPAPRSGEAGRLLGLTDLDSANGTFLNGRRVLSEQPLAVGDLIEIGNSRLHVRGIAPLAVAPT